MSGGTGRWKPYPAYKDSGVEWLGQVPEGWEVMRLKYISTCNDEILPETTDDDYAFQYVDISSVSLVEGIQHMEAVYFGTAPSRARRIVRNGDCIISTVRTYLKAISPIDFDAENVIVSTGFAVIRPKEYIFSGFIKYFVQSNGFVEEVCANSTGVSYPAINPTVMVGICCTCPSLAEQRVIAAFLDQQCSQIDSLITNKRRMLDLLDEKRRAIITQAVTRGLDPSTPMKDSGVAWLGQMPVGWEIKQIKRVSPVLRGASPRPIDDPVYFDDNGKFAWVRIADVTSSETFLEKTTQRLSELGANLSVKLESDSLFLSIAGSVGKPCITKIKCCIHDGFVYFPYLNINTKFLFYIFKSGEPYKGLGKMGTQLNLNTDTVGSIKIPIPSPSEQRAIADYLDAQTTALDAQKKNLEKSIDLLREYRASLITHAVTGKIDVRDFVPAR